MFKCKCMRATKGIILLYALKRCNQRMYLLRLLKL